MTAPTCRARGHVAGLQGDGLPSLGDDGDLRMGGGNTARRQRGLGKKRPYLGLPAWRFGCEQDLGQLSPTDLREMKAGRILKKYMQN